MVNITERAAEEIVKQAKEKSCLPTIRIGVRGGGCTGFSLFVEWNDSNNVVMDTDTWFERDGASVIVDKKSLIMLEGSTVDYVSTLMGRGFKIDAPKSTGSCGCGESVEF